MLSDRWFTQTIDEKFGCRFRAIRLGPFRQLAVVRFERRSDNEMAAIPPIVKQPVTP